MVFFTTIKDAFSALAMYVSVQLCLYAPFITPLLYGVSLGPRRRLLEIGPNGVRNMVIMGVEGRVVDRSLTRKREKINLGPLLLTRDCTAFLQVPSPDDPITNSTSKFKLYV